MVVLKSSMVPRFGKLITPTPTLNVLEINKPSGGIIEDLRYLRYLL